ncbi:MAG: hypothetical protein ACRD2C_28175 [Acidimicrobiales bacterium]
MNNRGQIVGGYRDAAGEQHGFLLRRGRYTTIDAPGRPDNIAWGLNDRGTSSSPNPASACTRWPHRSPNQPRALEPKRADPAITHPPLFGSGRPPTPLSYVSVRTVVSGRRQRPPCSAATGPPTTSSGGKANLRHLACRSVSTGVRSAVERPVRRRAISAEPRADRRCAEGHDNDEDGGEQGDGEHRSECPCPW